MKMPELTPVKEKKLHLHIGHLLKSSLFYIMANPLFCLCVFTANLAYMLLFKAIHGGISNPLSILWLIGYYIFWCAFYRYYYNLRPYFFIKAITASLKPSTKAMVFLFLVMLTIAFLPMLPLFLGYNELYLDFYERYMQIFEGIANNNSDKVAVSDVLLIYGTMALLAPVLICKPYIAWIASLCRRSVSFAQVGHKMRGNYGALVIISAILIFPEAVVSQLDKIWQMHNWLGYSINAMLFVYTNIVFAKMYDFFYVKN